MPHEVIMPALGMVQETGKLVSWNKSLGDEVQSSDILFEVETDKATMEVEAGASGFVAELRIAAGEETPIGNVIAIISDEKPDGAAIAAAPAAEPEPSTEPAPKAEPATQQTSQPAFSPSAPIAPAAQPAPNVEQGGKILASPKARRLALEQGLDLSQLAEQGVSMPYHVSDLETLRNLPTAASSQHSPASAIANLNAKVTAQAFDEFIQFAGEEMDLAMVWAAFGAGCLRMGLDVEARVADIIIGISGTSDAHNRQFLNPDFGAISNAAPTEADQLPALIVRDLSHSRITSGSMSQVSCPVLSVMRDGDDLNLSFTFSADWLSDGAAIQFLENFAARIEQPLRHIL